jgi:hypothetical protein
MFKSNIKYTNRYRDVYTWTKLSNNTYEFAMEGESMKYCRYGGKEGAEGIDTNDLEMFDPSGGPYVTLGDVIDGRKIKRLYSTSKGFGAEVE